MYKFLNTVLHLLWIYSFLVSSERRSKSDNNHGMFVNWSEHWLDNVLTYQKNYGMAVADIDADGHSDIFIAGFSGANIVLKYIREEERFANLALSNSPFAALMDEKGQAIGVAACDIDGDGREEIYVLNTNDAYAGISSYSDKLFKWRDGQYVDLFSDPVNQNISSKTFAGRSVACVDRFGTGKYGFVVATYADNRSKKGRFSLIEMDDYSETNDVLTGFIALKDSAEEAGIDKVTGGRGVVAGPILNSEGRSDLFFVNEGNSYLRNHGANFLFRNYGNGTFVDIAKASGIDDADEAGRGVTIADFNEDGLYDIVYGNWEGPNRLFLQSISNGRHIFNDVATPEFANTKTVRSVLVADFDNDGKVEILFNNIAKDGKPIENNLFTVTSYGTDNDPSITEIDLGDAREPDGYGTGAVYVDVDDDGVLDLLLSHGESVSQPVEVYKTHSSGKGHHYLRVDVRTKFGAPARGSSVAVQTNRGRLLSRTIDGGSGYLCQMEPIAHFGLGSEKPVKITIRWPDGNKFVWIPKDEDIDRTLLFYHPNYQLYQSALKASNLTSNVIINKTTAVREEL